MSDNFDEARLSSAWPFADGPRRVVLKLGSNVLSRPDATLDEERIRNVSRQASALIHKGCQAIVVTSGAVASGMAALGLKERPTNLPDLQALAAIGQSRLVAAWAAGFAEHGIIAAQVLLTRGDLEDRRRYLNARYTLETLIARNVVPVINENDTVATEELTFGDNDMLSAIIATTLSADLLAILTDIDGLCTGNPKKDPTARLIEVVERVTPEIEALASGAGSAVGKGGMITKLRAAAHANSFGIPAIVANGRRERIVEEVHAGRFRGTLFLSDRQPSGGRGKARWISTRSVHGVVTVDDGARRALMAGGRSLLPVGVSGVSGEFERGDVVSIRDASGREIARGIASFSAEQVERIKGRKAGDIESALGEKPGYEEVVHRDNLHLTTRQGAEAQSAK